MANRNNSKIKYQCAIIGAGRIGASFDAPKSRHILTHAHAYFSNPKTELVGFYDANYGTARQAAKVWRARAFRNLREMFELAKPDVVSICVPDEYHFSILQAVAKYKPKLIICEKPVTTDTKDTQAIIKLYQQKNIPVLINYSRRFDLVVQKLKKELVQQKYGRVLCSSLVYNKGIVHNGSHAVDLARYLFGEVEVANSLSSVNDFFPIDATVAAFVKLERCPQFYLMAADARSYSVFELDIFCEKARFHFTDSGFFLSKQTVKNSDLYKGYKVLSKPIIKKTGLSNSLLELVGNAIGHLESQRPLLCGIEDALKTQIVCAALLKK